MIGFLATGLTWLRAFKGPCLILAVVALVTGGTLGSCVTKSLTESRAMRAEKAAETLRADMATQTATAEARAAELRENAFRAIRERDQAITAAVDGIPGRVAALVNPKLAQLRSKLNDPAYDCLRTVSLPEQYLSGLRRPAGSAAAEADPDPDPR